MAEPVIEVFVCRGFSGHIVRVSLPAEEAVGSLIAKLMQQLDFPAPPEAVGLYNLTQDFEYVPTDSLARRGTRAGDLLLLAATTRCPRP